MMSRFIFKIFVSINTHIV